VDEETPSSQPKVAAMTKEEKVKQDSATNC
jgi:hypothetical protein